METINPGLALFLLMLGIMFSVAAGTYGRYSLRKNEFIRSGKSVYLEIGAIALALVLSMSFAFSGLYVLMFVALGVFAAVFSAALFGANPPWGEW